MNSDSHFQKDRRDRKRLNWTDRRFSLRATRRLKIVGALIAAGIFVLLTLFIYLNQSA
jgi:hypothetical protein